MDCGEEVGRELVVAGSLVVRPPRLMPTACVRSPPIENAFSKLKAALRKAAQRTVAGLWAAIGNIIPTFTPTECTNYFANAGYDPN